MQAAGGDVRAAAELAAGVQLGRHHLDAGQPGLGLLVGGDAAAVVVDLDGVVGVQGDLDPVRGAGQRLVHPVVDDLPQAVHQPAGVGGADVHARALAHRLEALEDQEVRGVVRVVDRGAPAWWNWSCVDTESSGAAAPNLPATRRSNAEGSPAGRTCAVSGSERDHRSPGDHVTMWTRSILGSIEPQRGPALGKRHTAQASTSPPPAGFPRHGNPPSGKTLHDWMTCQAPRRRHAGESWPPSLR